MSGSLFLNCILQRNSDGFLDWKEKVSCSQQPLYSHTLINSFALVPLVAVLLASDWLSSLPLVLFVYAFPSLSFPFLAYLFLSSSVPSLPE